MRMFSASHFFSLFGARLAAAFLTGRFFEATTRVFLARDADAGGVSGETATAERGNLVLSGGDAGCWSPMEDRGDELPAWFASIPSSFAAAIDARARGKSGAM